MKTTVYVVRHGESNINASNDRRVITKLIKTRGTRLSKKGIEQAHARADDLSKHTLHAIYSSMLTRAKHTAQIIAQKHKKSVTAKIEIHERFYGSGYAKLSDLLRKEARKKVEDFEHDHMKMNYRFYHDGETAQEAALRLKKNLVELASNHQGETIAIVAHGNLMRSFLVHMGWAKYNELPHGAIENTGYFVLEVDGESITVKKTVGVNKKK